MINVPGQNQDTMPSNSHLITSSRSKNPILSLLPLMRLSSEMFSATDHSSQNFGDSELGQEGRSMRLQLDDAGISSGGSDRPFDLQLLGYRLNLEQETSTAGSVHEKDGT